MPPIEHWGEMFINGIKLIIVNIVYFIIPIIVFLVSGGLAILSLAFTKANNPASIIPFIASLGIAVIISIVRSSFVLIHFSWTLDPGPCTL